MLKSCVMYLPGTGGTFLHRVLRLSPKVSATEIADTVEQRFEHFVQWDATHWKSKESYGYPAYRDGLEDYVVNEQSSSWYIDVWHAKELLNNLNVLWDQTFFESLIIIDSNITHKEFLLKNQNSKGYYLDWDAEYQAQEICKKKFDNIAILIPFDSFFNWDLFLPEITKINNQLELELPMDLVEKLWTAWFTESCKAWIK